MNTPLDEAEAYLAANGLLNQPGALLYSGEEALRPGPVYLLGLNPGGDGKTTLKDSIAASRQGHNSYLDEKWAPGGHLQPEGQSTLQRRVQHLCRLMGLETRQVPASNLVFTRSPRLHGHASYGADLQLCLPVHRIFLAAINPKVLVTFGNISHFGEAFQIRHKETRLADHGNWKAHRGEARLDDRVMMFANVPHMSLWASDGREHVLRWALEPTGLVS